MTFSAPDCSAISGNELYASPCGLSGVGHNPRSYEPGAFDLASCGVESRHAGESNAIGTLDSCVKSRISARPTRLLDRPGVGHKQRQEKSGSLANTRVGWNPTSRETCNIPAATSAGLAYDLSLPARERRVKRSGETAQAATLGVQQPWPGLQILASSRSIEHIRHCGKPVSDRKPRNAARQFFPTAVQMKNE